jgi:two-component system, LytTR family, response regulator
MAIKCVVIDDEPLARKLLMEHITDTPNTILVAEWSSVLQVENAILEHEADLLFLDIEMPKIKGIDFLKMNITLPPVIFTTAHSEYAFEAFQFNVIDYLLKPITYERFFKAIKKFESIKELKPKKEYFFIKINGKLEKILLKDVIYFEAKANYIYIHTDQGKFLTYMSLKQIEEELKDTDFIQIHKSYIVAFSKLQSITSNEVWMSNKTILRIGNSYKEDFSKKLEHFLFKKI